MRPPRLPSSSGESETTETPDAAETAEAADAPDTLPDTLPDRLGGPRRAEEPEAPARPALRAVEDRPEPAARPADDADSARGTRGRAGDPIARFWTFVEGGRAHTTFWMLFGSALALTVIGAVMVLSSSAIETVGSTTTAYGLFLRQAMWALVGFVGIFVVVLMPQRLLQRIAWPALIVTVLGLALVLSPLGHEVNGNRNWLQAGPINVQPAEFAKLALIVWAGSVLARKGTLVRQLHHAVIPVIFPGAASILLFIMIGRDLGTALIFGVIVAAVLFVAGTKLRYFVIAASLGVLAAIIGVITSPNRLARVSAWLNIGDACEGSGDLCYQAQHGLYALASGGWWGVGLGQSRQKWNYIPEAENDFIFTILGEELGLLGALTVLMLYAVLAIGMFRVAARAQSRFVKITTLGIMAWVIGQTFINLGMVTGLLPVIGVPLPFISYGGSSLTSTLLAVGVVMSFAHRQRRLAPDPGQQTEPEHRNPDQLTHQHAEAEESAPVKRRTTTS
ncbi:putative lipid II flippase FtsW [Nesterenkonia aerolata]|uniref:Probable peptidoglycan glycosyltransferase FtsW n=1 Tax=Nesterenkonia aerolata TaxID=3074079 RepID=A0ABU2DPN5_9MICC|nr:putative lipid II flippase FtsW [Nesterenkonia sp. LY-0111]MDR8018477.1 putative lipid II flippase FtsW [Nesterenkonia sp. LY-0111]